MNIYKKQTLAETFSVYFDRRMIKILLLGAISGFPWVIIGSSLSLWLKEDGLSRSTIGWAGLIFAVYAFNYLWAPIIDRVRIPWLTNKIGHRRGWIVLMQTIILTSLIFWSLIEPSTNLALIISVGLIIAMLLSISGLDFVTAISGAASSISNVGPGLGEIIGPDGNYKSLPDLSKWILATGMLLGRLELFAVLVLFFPSFWRN